jgi:hypothetical protein
MRLLLAISLLFSSACAFPEFEPGAPAEPVVITAVAGNSELAEAGGPGVFRDALVVSGEGLHGALTAELRGLEGAPDFALEVRRATGGEAELALPADLMAGTYEMVVGRGGQQATTRVQLLRGPKGPAGAAALDGLVTWDGLRAALPDPASFVDAEAALTTYALASDLPDLGAYATKDVLLGLLSEGEALDAYAHLTELLDPQGYLTAEELLAGYAAKAELPDLSDAVPKSALPDLGPYATKAQAGAAVTKAQAAELLLDKAAMDAAFLRKTGPLSSVHVEQVREIVRAALADKPCPGGMVPVGASCVDVFEATVREEPCGQGGKAYGVSGDDYGASFPDSGVTAKPLYACSEPGAKPARFLTWFQAARACAASGKRLCTEPEWQVAEAGTPDAVAGPCVLSGTAPATGSADSECVSSHGVIDGVGSVAEWTAAWAPGGPSFMTTVTSSTKAWPAGFGDGQDEVANWNGSVRVAEATWTNGVPTAVVRGGAWASGAGGGSYSVDMTIAPSASADTVGFRCCRSR